MKLTQLNKECLENMPMLIDSIYDATKVLGEILDPYYDKVESRIEQFMDEAPSLKCEIDEDACERQIIEVFQQETSSGISDCVSVCSKLTFYNQRRKRIVNEFTIEFGYLATSSENEIYFNLTPAESNEDSAVFNEVVNEIGDSLKTWYVEKDDDFIELRITPDQNLTEKTIKDCFEDFMKHILNPLLARLND